MALGFGFKTRNPARDRETDMARLQRLAAAIQAISDEVAAEKTGLEKRYKAVAADAVFLDEAVGNDEVGQANSAKVDGMAATLINYERRVAELSRQLGSLEELQQYARKFIVT
ncbi:hypothetical protein [Aquamicrobium sp. LC103]|uniref:hypothetical protein n=1 Tax=Aquamicrobium sp. LC103 TaxID=1120658 RepID=UPI00063E780B|nr:hypothetical protein [Aquamicrobium sp. LC103]TKT69330.1 hypothetical protein XW59_027750 [Aquamicrobium sp. LC103]